MIYATIYRHESDCTNGGVSSRYWNMEVIEEKDVPNYEPSNPDRTLVLVRRMWRGKRSYYLRPLNEPKGMIGPMFGGNYGKVDSSVCRYPLPIHDRYETPDEYEALSR